MKIFISYDSEQPLYEQIEQCIKQGIFDGELKDNEHLPSVRQLSADLNVSAITIKRAYADLEKDGFIYTVTGRGTFVKISDFDSIITERKVQILKELEEEILNAKEASISMDDVKALVDKIYK